MGKKTLLPKVGLHQLIAVAAACTSVVFLLAFGSQIVEIYRLRSALAIADQGVGRLCTEQAALEATLTYVQSDEYVEQVARAELNKVRPGDHRIIVVTREAPTGTPSPGAQLQPAPSGGTYVSNWWELLFGS